MNWYLKLAKFYTLLDNPYEARSDKIRVFVNPNEKEWDLSLGIEGTARIILDSLNIYIWNGSLLGHDDFSNMTMIYGLNGFSVTYNDIVFLPKDQQDVDIINSIMPNKFPNISYSFHNMEMGLENENY